jgi:hypothetical protein
MQNTYKQPQKLSATALLAGAALASGAGVRGPSSRASAEARAEARARPRGGCRWRGAGRASGRPGTCTAARPLLRRHRRGMRCGHPALASASPLRLGTLRSCFGVQIRCAWNLGVPSPLAEVAQRLQVVAVGLELANHLRLISRLAPVRTAVLSHHTGHATCQWIRHLGTNAKCTRNELNINYFYSIPNQCFPLLTATAAVTAQRDARHVQMRAFLRAPAGPTRPDAARVSHMYVRFHAGPPFGLCSHVVALCTPCPCAALARASAQRRHSSAPPYGGEIRGES